MDMETRQSFNEEQDTLYDLTEDLADDLADNYQSYPSINSHQKKSPMLHSGVTWLDRWLVKKMVDVVGNPPVRISLWDGIEVTPSCENPVAVIGQARDIIFSGKIISAGIAAGGKIYPVVSRIPF